MELQVGVKVLLKNSEGKYLFMRRTSYESAAAGKWDIPGGRIDVATGLRENLAREVMEETGLAMTSEPRIIAAQDIFPKVQDRHVVRITYIGAAEGEVRLSSEHSEYRWMTFAQMQQEENLDSYVRELLKTGTIS
jgi:8-oxo-dGTP diphosphatase